MNSLTAPGATLRRRLTFPLLTALALLAPAAHAQAPMSAGLYWAATLHGWVAAMLALMALYLLSPVDLVPDWVPLLGWLDDIALVGLVLPVLLRLLPPEVLRQARRRAGLDSRRAEQTRERQHPERVPLPFR